MVAIAKKIGSLIDSLEKGDNISLDELQEDMIEDISSPIIKLTCHFKLLLLSILIQVRWKDIRGKVNLSLIKDVFPNEDSSLLSFTKLTQIYGETKQEIENSFYYCCFIVTYLLYSILEEEFIQEKVLKQFPPFVSTVVKLASTLAKIDSLDKYKLQKFSLISNLNRIPLNTFEILRRPKQTFLVQYLQRKIEKTSSSQIENLLFRKLLFQIQEKESTFETEKEFEIFIDNALSLPVPYFQLLGIFRKICEFRSQKWIEIYLRLLYEKIKMEDKKEYLLLTNFERKILFEKLLPSESTTSSDNVFGEKLEIYFNRKKFKTDESVDLAIKLAFSQDYLTLDKYQLLETITKQQKLISNNKKSIMKDDDDVVKPNDVIPTTVPSKKPVTASTLLSEKLNQRTGNNNNNNKTSSSKLTSVVPSTTTTTTTSSTQTLKEKLKLRERKN